MAAVLQDMSVLERLTEASFAGNWNLLGSDFTGRWEYAGRGPNCTQRLILS
jgi:hypothetical protein